MLPNLYLDEDTQSDALVAALRSRYWIERKKRIG
jgi:hypothetical protein